jgi:hypothetical protein
MGKQYWQLWLMVLVDPTYVRTDDFWWKPSNALSFGATDEIPHGRGSDDESSKTFASLTEALPIVISIATVGICLVLAALLYLVLSRKRGPADDSHWDGRRKTRALPSDMVLV